MTCARTQHHPVCECVRVLVSALALLGAIVAVLCVRDIVLVVAGAMVGEYCDVCVCVCVCGCGWGVGVSQSTITASGQEVKRAHGR
jgi:hypothetical protein